ncbi:oxidoreductase [Amylibacter marinus]|uniref:Oxidoreductase n=1 Tax=Amylibacter marinus TaxID=1475483 RepID=A0ABQ5VX06_9RHOB|nr:FAD-binding oxidoreductase [Amylibacter marinus]GLQ35732.1 oxidoreductase [Amylibacter marinus]
MTSQNSMDVIIAGAGIFGLSCAYACARAGMSVTVLEADKVGAGASAGIVGALAPYTPDQWHAKKQYQFEALVSAEAHWGEVDKLSGQTSGYGRIGRLAPIMDERTYKLAHDRHQEAKVNWRDYRWEVRAEDALIPASAAPMGVIYDTLSARLYPRMALASLVRACRRLGVEIIEERRVTGFGDRMVFGRWGEMRGDAVILAGGYEGFHLLDYHFGTQMGTGVKGQAAILDIDLGDAPQIYADGVYIIPHANGTTAVGSTSENKWGQPSGVDHLLDEVVAKARAICPAIRTADVIQTWSGLRPKARRRDPLLGEISDVAGVYAAMGGFKIGFGLAHKIGYSLADIVAGGDGGVPRSFTIAHHLE